MYMTSLLNEGDELLVHGMVVRLVGPRQQFEGNNGTVYLWPEAHIIEGQAPEPWSDRKTWDIQGNDRALWVVRKEYDHFAVERARGMEQYG